MNEELPTTEYLKKLEQVKLSDSSRERIKSDLLAYVRFHGAKEVVAPAGSSVLSPFLMWFLKPATVALGLVLLVGATSFLLQNTNPAGYIPPQEKSFNESVAVAPSQNSETPTADSVTTISQAGNAPAEAGDTTPSSASTKVATKDATQDDVAFMASDEMSTMLSQGTISIEDYTTDLQIRDTSLRGLIKKYDSELEEDLKTEFKTKLDTANKLVVEAGGKSEEDARTNLDKATVLVGEVEATLSTLGQVEVKDGIIVDIDFSIDPMAGQ